MPKKKPRRESDKEILNKTRDHIQAGRPVLEEAFKLGFKACIESVKDKGYEKLGLLLDSEYSQL